MAYLDYASATPLDPRVRETMEPYFSSTFGNPASPHQLGSQAKEALDKARAAIAGILSCSPDDIIFTSGGTESLNLAIQGVARAVRAQTGKSHIIVSSVEHEAVLKPCKALAQEGFTITYLEVDEYGMVHPETLFKAIRADTALVSVMYANNEVGTINNIQQLSAICRERGVPCHTDACQAGMLPLNVQELGVNLLTLNSSKIYGPKGAGLLYVRHGTPLQPIMYGGGQEHGHRSGTENIPSIIGFAHALALTQVEKASENQRLKKLHDMVLYGIKEIPSCRLNGHPTIRMPGNLSISFAGVEASQLLEELDKQGICTAAGSACTSASLEPSHVLLAMKVPLDYAHGTLRLTLGRYTTEEDIVKLTAVLPGIVAKLRK